MSYIKQIDIIKIVAIKLERYKTNPGLLVMKCRFLGPHTSTDNEYTSAGKASMYKKHQCGPEESDLLIAV